MGWTRDLAKKLVLSAFHSVGLHVTRYRVDIDAMGIDAMSDIRSLLSHVANPTVFDVGANVGQSVTRFKELFPRCELHAFEPSPDTFRHLEANTTGFENVRLVNAGVGSTSGMQVLIENDHSDMSSFLRPGPTAHGKIMRETPIGVTTLDEYCADQGVSHIDLLKTDTQGYDFEVIRGAAGLMAANQIRLIHTEVIFSEMYEDLPPFDELYRFLVNQRFRLIAFYNFWMQHQAAGWCDALFANECSRLALDEAVQHTLEKSN